VEFGRRAFSISVSPRALERSGDMKAALTVSLFLSLLWTQSALPSETPAATFTITVKDNLTFRPLTGVEVRVVGAARSSTSDSEGRSDLGSLPEGLHTVHCRLGGYESTWEPIAVREGRIEPAEIVMAVEDPPTDTAGLPPRAIPHPLGINVHTHFHSADEINGVADTGFRFHRMLLDQNLITNAHWQGCRDGKYVFGYRKGGGGDGPVATVPAYLERGVRRVAIVEYDSAKLNGLPRTDEERADWAEFCRQAAATFKGSRIIYEFSNEPDIYTPNWNRERDVPLYIEAAREAARAIHSADPDAVVCAPGGAGCDDFLIQGLGNIVDAYSDHFYWDGAPENGIPDRRRVRELLDKHSADGRRIPIINSEQGYGVNTGEGYSVPDAATYARYMVRVFLIDLMHDVRLSCWYDWNHLRDVPEGLAALRVFITELDGYRFLRRIDAGDPGAFVLAFRKGKDRRYAVWSAGGGVREVRFLAGSPSVEIVSLDGGGRTIAETERGWVRVSISGDVQYVEPIHGEQAGKR